jgi:hypothetical protein
MHETLGPDVYSVGPGGVATVMGDRKLSFPFFIDGVFLSLHMFWISLLLILCLDLLWMVLHLWVPCRIIDIWSL